MNKKKKKKEKIIDILVLQVQKKLAMPL